MKLEVHDRLRSPEVREATRVLIRDGHGNPAAVFIQVTADHVFMSVRGQPDFEAALRNLGVLDTAVTTVVNAKTLPELVIR